MEHKIFITVCHLGNTMAPPTLEASSFVMFFLYTFMIQPYHTNLIYFLSNKNVIIVIQRPCVCKSQFPSYLIYISWVRNQNSQLQKPSEISTSLPTDYGQDFDSDLSPIMGDHGVCPIMLVWGIKQFKKKMQVTQCRSQMHRSRSVNVNCVSQTQISDLQPDYTLESLVQLEKAHISFIS